MYHQFATAMAGSNGSPVCDWDIDGLYSTWTKHYSNVVMQQNFLLYQGNLYYEHSKPRGLQVLVQFCDATSQPGTGTRHLPAKSHSTTCTSHLPPLSLGLSPWSTAY